MKQVQITQMAKLLGIDTVHEYINIVTKGFSANMVYNNLIPLGKYFP